MRWIARCGLVLGGVLGAMGCAASSEDPWTSSRPPEGGPSGPSPAPQAWGRFGPVVSAEDAPPPISGGTLAITADGRTAVAADPDRDLVHVVDLQAAAEIHTIQLAPHDEPGRVALDAAGRAHVALRRGGALVTLDLASGAVLARRPVCGEPRGVAVDDARGVVHVACATGELVTMAQVVAPPGDGGPIRTLRLGRDLRDVIVRGDGLVVSRFRAAELLVLDADGAIVRRLGPTSGPLAVASVAWRTIGLPNGDVWMLHQRAAQKVETGPGGYGGGGPGVFDAGSDAGDAGADGGPLLPPPFVGCKFPVATVVTSFTSAQVDGTEPLGFAPTPQLGDALVAVDLAISGNRMVIAAPGNAFGPQGNHLVGAPVGTVLPSLNCGRSAGSLARGMERPREIVSVAARGEGQVVTFSREPAELAVWDLATPNGLWDSTGKRVVVKLAGASRVDTGHDLFHQRAGRPIACASCHPEGGDDGIVWLIDGEGFRTPSLRGTIAGTAPYHWEGTEATLSALAEDVYSERMGGGGLLMQEHAAFGGWMERVPRPTAPAPTDPVAAGRGKLLFEGAAGCTACHSGPRMTNNLSMSLGGAAPMQVPSLIGVGARAPFLHDGCAKTLAQRFDPKCRSASHGAALEQAQIDDLVAYMETL